MTKRRARRGEAIQFFRDAVVMETDDCILWPFGTGSHGYPDIKSALTDEPHTCGHRAVCVLKKGDRRSERLEAEHLCGHPLCINHRHIDWATCSKNNYRRNEHGTMPKGENHPHVKLSDDEVETIRASKESARVLGERHGIHKQYVWMIRNNKTRVS